MRKRAPFALMLGGMLAAAGGVAVNRVDGSVLQMVVVFVVACGLLVASAAVARWGGGSAGLRLRAADAQGRPRELGAVDLGELGVHWSRASADGYGLYVNREVDGELGAAISGGQTLVALAGATLAGGTRTLAEAARRYLADSCLMFFDQVPGTGLADLLAEAQRRAHGGPAVLWLENADLALLSQFSARLLAELRPGLRILMTLNASLLDAGVLPGAAAEVLSAPGACVRLGLVTAAERDRLAHSADYARIAAAHEDKPVLMGQLMVSFDRVTDALQTPDEDAICRVAVLHAAVDWQRAAVPSPLTRKVIEKLYQSGYWRQASQMGPDAVASQSQFGRAIEYLTAASAGQGRLLDGVYSGRVTHLRPYPLLEVIADNPERPPGWAISETLWKYLASTLDNPARLSVGLTACMRGDYRHGRRMLDPLDSHIIPAEVIYRAAIDAHRAGESTAARRWYTKAIDARHGDAVVRSMLGLGTLEAKLGHVDEARRWYSKAIETGDTDVAPHSMFSLGGLEQQQGRMEEARDLYGRAIATGHSDAAPLSMISLANLERQQGHIEEARALYTDAISSGHADVAPFAMLNLAGLEREQGRVGPVRDLLTRAIRSSNADAAPQAMLYLAGLEREQGRVGPARRWYTEAIGTGHGDVVPRSMFELGLFEAELGRVDEARDLYERVIATSHADVAPQAMTNLAILDQRLGLIANARELHDRAIATGHATAAPRAMVGRGVLELQQGRIEEARRWLNKVLSAGDPEAAADAMYNLGVIEHEQGHIEQARAWLARAVASGDAKRAPQAQERLNELQRLQDELQRAANDAKYGHP